MNSNLFIIFKQTLKGVFKYKIQFLIILILSFLSTFMITISLASNSNLTNSYNDVVGKVNPFNYVSTSKINGNYSTDSFFVEGEDFQDSEFTSFIDSDGNKTKNYNFNVTKEDSYWRNTIWQPDSNVINYNNLAFKLGWSGIAMSKMSKTEILNFDWSRNSSLKYQDYWFYTSIMMNALTFGFFESLSNGNSSEILNNGSLISEYLKKDKELLSKMIEIGQKFKDIEKNDDPDPDPSIKNFSVYKLKLQKNYLSSLTMTQSERNFIYQIVIESAWLVRLLYLELFDYKEEIENFSTNYQKISSKNLTDSSFDEKSYQFFFGCKLENEEDVIDTPWINKDNFSYNLSFDIRNSDTVDNYANIEQDENKSQNELSFEALSEKGLNGQLNPLILITNNKTVVSSMTFCSYKNYFHLEKNNVFEKWKINTVDYEKSGNWTSIKNLIDFYYNNFKNISDYALSIVYTEHLKMAAETSDMDLYIRKEIILNDSLSSVKYRGVVLDNNNKNNFTILEGKRPISYNEIGISEQFAKKKNISVGDFINIGKSRLYVSCIATDAYSYYPISDPDMPIAQSSTGAIIYGSSETLENIIISKNTDKPDDYAAISNINIFITNIGSTAALQKNINIFNNYQGKIYKILNMTSFDESYYRFSWTLQPLTTSAFSFTIIIISIIIIVISFFALIICIKKTIHFNSKQIGILKSLGEKSWKISLSYTSYSILIVLLSIPLAWAIGIFAQNIISNIFFNYFSIKSNTFCLEFKSLLIPFIFIGIIGSIISFLFSYTLINKPVLQIITSTTKFKKSKFIEILNQTIFKKSNFRTRFTLSLASTNRHTIRLMMLVVSISTFLISIGIMIPGTIEKGKKAYYSAIKYSNEFEYGTGAPVLNMPLAKTTTSYWNGQDSLEKDWVNDDLKLDNSDSYYGFYKNPNSYSESIDDLNPIPKYEYSSKNGVNYSYVNILKNQTKNGIVDEIGNVFGNAFLNTNGTGFSIGLIDKFIGLILNSSDPSEIVDPNSLSKYINNWTDESKQEYARKFSSFLTSSIPSLIKAVLKDSGTSDDSENWKKQIIDIISSNLPPYVKSFMNNDSRYEQYIMGWNNDSYVPGEETYQTNVKFKTCNDEEINITGIDNASVAYSIKEKDLNWTEIPDSITDKIENIVNGDSVKEDIIYNGFKLYDANTKTLNIPVIFNKQSSAYYGGSNGNQLNDILQENTNMMGYKKINSFGSYDFVELPKYAWAYDDSDFKASSYFQNQLKELNENDKEEMTGAKKFSKDTNWLDLYALKNSKMTYKDLYYNDKDGKKQLSDYAFMFDDNIVENNTVKKTYIRPYYQYNNVKLFIPISDISNKKNDTTYGDLKSYFGKTWLDNSNKYTDSTIITKMQNNSNDNWFNIVKADDVPETTKKAYDSISDYYIELSPYDVEHYTSKPSGIAALTTDSIYSWLWSVGNNVSNSPLKMINQSKELKNINKINLVKKGEIDSYNSKIIVSDIKLTNILNGYSNYVDYGSDNSLFDMSNEIKSGTVVNGISSKFNQYKLKEISLVNDLQNETSVYSTKKKYAQMWHNGKLSRITEPLSLTSSINYTTNTNVGLIFISSGAYSGSKMQNIINTENLLSTTKAIIDEVVHLAFTISIFLVSIVIITSSLLIMVIGDIYISQYKRFMVLMRSLGYSKIKIRTFAFGFITISCFVSWSIVTIFISSIIAIILGVIAQKGLAIPFGMTWWPIALSFLIVFSSFFGSLYICSRKATNSQPAELMKETNE